MPLKIAEINNQRNISSLEQKEKNNISKGINNEFSQKLTKISGNSLQEKIANLMNEIDAQSKKIEKNLHLGEIVRYKKLVKDFLNLTINNSHTFSKDNFLDRRGRHRVLSIIKKVDNELEQLTQDFLSKEKNSLKILRRMDGIKGLLVDILL